MIRGFSRFPPVPRSSFVMDNRDCHEVVPSGLHCVRNDSEDGNYKGFVLDSRFRGKDKEKVVKKEFVQVQENSRNSSEIG